MKPYYDTDKHGYCKGRCCKRGRRFRNAMYPKGTARVLARMDIEEQTHDDGICDGLMDWYYYAAWGMDAP